VTVVVDAVVYYRVFNAIVSVVNVLNAHQSTRLLAQTTLRNVLGTKSLSEILSDRENISHFMQVTEPRILCLTAYRAGLTIRGLNTNVRRGPFFVREARIVLSVAVHFFPPKKLTTFFSRRYVQTSKQHGKNLAADRRGPPPMVQPAQWIIRP